MLNERNQIRLASVRETGKQGGEGLCVTMESTDSHTEYKTIVRLTFRHCYCKSARLKTGKSRSQDRERLFTTRGISRIAERRPGLLDGNACQYTVHHCMQRPSVSKRTVWKIKINSTLRARVCGIQRYIQKQKTAKNGI